MKIKVHQKNDNKTKKSSYIKYQSNYKTNFMLHRLHNDSGYPQQLSLHLTSSPIKNYIQLNKQNLKNLQTDRIYSTNPPIKNQFQSLNPSQILNIKKQQLRRKNQTRMSITYSTNLPRKQMSNCISVTKMNKTFQIKDKNREFKEKFISNEGKINNKYTQLNHRLGTTSFIRKRNLIIKKEAYEKVFGMDISSLSKTYQIKQPQIQNKGKKSPSYFYQTLKNQRQARSSEMKTLIRNMKQYQQDINGIKHNDQQKQFDKLKQYQEKQVQSQLITWIKYYKNNQMKKLSNDRRQIKTLNDLKKIDQKYFNQMKNHKQKRLSIRKRQIHQNNLSVISKISPLLKPHSFQQNQTINTHFKQISFQSSIDSIQDSEVQCYKTIQKTLKQKLVNIGRELIRIISNSQIYGVKKDNFFYAFWRVCQPYEKEGSYTFFNAIKLGDLKVVKTFIKKDQIYLFQKDQKQRSPLMVAIKYNQIQIVNYILKYGVNVDYQSCHHINGLYYAIMNQSVQIVKLLFLNGASPWSSKRIKYSHIQMSQAIHNLFKTAKKIWIAVRLTKWKFRMKYWEQNKHRINQFEDFRFD